MTPRQYKIHEEELKQESEALAAAWAPRGNKKLKTLLKEMEPFALNPKDVPLIIRLIENPKYDIGLFSGSTTLGAHDCIHILLGRGLLLKDEAFVIGYTMGSTKKMKRWRRNLFMFISKYLYPKGYKFGENERFIYNLGVVAGSKCPTDLSEVDFTEFLDLTLPKIRSKLGIDKDFLKHCYAIEKKSFKDIESQRLL